MAGRVKRAIEAIDSAEALQAERERAARVERAKGGTSRKIAAWLAGDRSARLPHAAYQLARHVARD